jgi:hypothetical protein
MAIRTIPPRLVAVQVTMVYREGDVETLKCVDIPVRDPNRADISLDCDERGMTLSARVDNDPNYTIQYVIRDHQAVHEEDGKLHPYCDGINSDHDLDMKTGILRRSLEREKSVRAILEVENHRLKKAIKRAKKELSKLKKA